MNYKIYVSDRNYNEYTIYNAKTMKKNEVHTVIEPLKLKLLNCDIFTIIKDNVKIIHSPTRESKYISGVLVLQGNKTYGKGLVQQSRKLSYNARLKVTVAKYYTPSGRCIQNVNHTKGYNNYLEKESLNNTEDSLNDNRQSFQTRSGRTVYDGGGIDPDIKIHQIEYPDILIELVRNNHIFKFGNLIHNTLPKYKSVSEFSFSDDHYNEFVNYLDTTGFTFKNNQDDIINLIEVSLEEFDQDKFNLTELYTDLEILKSSVAENKKTQLQSNKSIISKRLEGNLMTRLFYEKGRIENSLKDDDYIYEAIRVLKNKEEYRQILAP